MPGWKSLPLPSTKTAGSCDCGGLSVTRISVDHQLTFLLGPETWTGLLQGPCRLAHGSAGGSGPQDRLVPEQQNAAAALALLGAKVVSAAAFKTGTLRLVFDNGLQLNCQADPSCEAWQITGTGSLRFVRLPGRGLAVWPRVAASH
ncbi:DUF6188 family protein [Streptomyces sp. Marseille-Q5077]|uniref:DUF6188 family protein n=1 Tax=Streptomyces sp. Marseille-Q5077 TaxID=3418995 RepID=UPI003D041EC5